MVVVSSHGGVVPLKRNPSPLLRVKTWNQRISTLEEGYKRARTEVVATASNLLANLSGTEKQRLTAGGRETNYLGLDRVAMGWKQRAVKCGSGR